LTAPDGAAVQGGANVAEGCGEGGQVSVIDLPGVDLLGELGEGVRLAAGTQVVQKSPPLNYSASAELADIRP